MLESRSITSLEKKKDSRYRSVRHESESLGRLTARTLASPRSSQRCVTMVRPEEPPSRRVRADFSRSRRAGRESERSPSVPLAKPVRKQWNVAFSIFVGYTGWVGLRRGPSTGSHIRGTGPCVRLFHVVSRLVVVSCGPRVREHTCAYASSRNWVRCVKEVTRDRID